MCGECSFFFSHAIGAHFNEPIVYLNFVLPSPALCGDKCMHILSLPPFSLHLFRFICEFSASAAASSSSRGDRVCTMYAERRFVDPKSEPSVPNTIHTLWISFESAAAAAVHTACDTNNSTLDCGFYFAHAPLTRTAHLIIASEHLHRTPGPSILGRS